MTTHSLRALRLYSEAVANFWWRPRWDLAEINARAALAEDSSFASAYTLLAWSLKNQGEDSTEYVPIAERAVALSDRVTERVARRGRLIRLTPWQFSGWRHE